MSSAFRNNNYVSMYTMYIKQYMSSNVCGENILYMSFSNSNIMLYQLININSLLYENEI